MRSGAIDVGLLLLRLAVSGILVAHATQKLLGWFSGQGVEGSAAVFEKLGQRPGRMMVFVASTCELITSALISFGAVTPAATAIGMGAMLVAGASLWGMSKKFWNAMGGGEYPYVLAVCLAVVAFTGPGAYSLDALLDAPWHDLPAGRGTLVGVASIAVAIVASLPPTISGRRNLKDTGR